MTNKHNFSRIYVKRKKNLSSASSLNHDSKEIGLVLTQFSKDIWFIVLFRKNMCEIGEFLSQTTTCLLESKSYFGKFLLFVCKIIFCQFLKWLCVFFLGSIRQRKTIFASFQLQKSQYGYVHTCIRLLET